jgi:hypothetical protein
MFREEAEFKRFSKRDPRLRFGLVKDTEPDIEF